MQEFFNYQSPYRTEVFIELNIFEKVLPFVILIIVGALIYKFKDVLKENNMLEKRFRYIVGTIFLILYSSHYILRFALYGFDTIILPFHLCSISMFFAIILWFTNNRTIFTFVFMTGIAGGLISYATPVLGYNAEYYRYYQFFIAHGILILTPFYYVFVHGYVPRDNEVRNSFLILQTIAIFLMVFNYYMNTDFMFLFLDKAKLEKFPVIQNFGGIPFYIIWVEIVAMLYFYGTYRIISHIEKKTKLEVSYDNS